MLAKLMSFGLNGLNGYPINVEVDMHTGVPACDIVGLADTAVKEAKEQGIHGKATTPFLLAKIKDITGGSSLDANIQLVYNNARLAAKTACELCSLS